jgi:hypothetical protein
VRFSFDLNLSRARAPRCGAARRGAHEVDVAHPQSDGLTPAQPADTHQRAEPPRLAGERVPLRRTQIHVALLGPGQCDLHHITNRLRNGYRLVAAGLDLGRYQCVVGFWTHSKVCPERYSLISQQMT